MDQNLPQTNPLINVPHDAFDTNKPDISGKLSKRGKNWQTVEDEQLAKSWLHVSQDAIFGNEQKVDTFWSRITEHFAQHSTCCEERNSRSIQQREAYGFNNYMKWWLLYVDMRTMANNAFFDTL